MHQSSLDSTDVRLNVGGPDVAAGHLTDGSGREPPAPALACDVPGPPQLRRAFHERGEAHSSNLSTTKHAAGYKLPVVPNVKHNVTEKVAQVNLEADRNRVFTAR